MYYALTVNADHVITGVHESLAPIISGMFEKNPELAGDTVLVVESTAEFRSGIDIRCFNQDGALKPILWCIENGYMELPPGKEIINGELVDKARPADEQPKTLKEYLDEQFEAVRQENMTTQKASTVMFRALAQTDVIKPDDALDNAGMFPVWADCIGQRADPGSYWRHADKLYRVNAGQGHTIQSDWAPGKAASLFSMAANPAEAWPKWIQPTGAHNAYAKGAKVTHNGKRWVSTADGNVWAPAAYGWIVQ